MADKNLTFAETSTRAAEVVPLPKKTAPAKPATPAGALPSATVTTRPSLDLQNVAAAALLLLGDVAVLLFCFGIALAIRLEILPNLFSFFPRAVPANLVFKMWWFPVAAILCFAYEHLYTVRRPFWREVSSLVKALTLAFVVTLAIVSLAKLSGEVSRTVIVLTYMLSLAALPIWRYVGKTTLGRVGIWRQRVLVLGAGKTGELVAQALTREKYLGYEIIGFLDDDPGKKSGIWVNGHHFPVLGGFRDSERVIGETGVRHLIVAAPGMEAQALVALINRLQPRAASVSVVPDLFGIPVMGVEADYSFDEQMLSFRIRNNLASSWNILGKRAFDLLASSVILIAILPVLGIIALAVKLDSPGPVIFAYRRIGRGGREFNCYKFRTMFINNEEILRQYLKVNPAANHEWKKYAKLRGHDPRVTRLGRFLRKYSLDELPQLLNVLKGEMSLVGPRPYLPREQARLGNFAATVLLARPGITGLWQVSGRNEIDFEGRLQLESWYIRNWSLWLDITIIFRTIGVVFSRRGAY